MPTEPDGKEAILAWWIDITELKKTDRELREKLEQLARFRRLAVGRESKMIALKKEINEFLNSLIDFIHKALNLIGLLKFQLINQCIGQYKLVNRKS